VVAGMFYGIKPAIVAIVLHAARIGQRALKTACYGAWRWPLSHWPCSTALSADRPESAA
jgi:chromate transporter